MTLETKILQFVEHKCDKAIDPESPCTCGLDGLIAVVRGQESAVAELWRNFVWIAKGPLWLVARLWRQSRRVRIWTYLWLARYFTALAQGQQVISLALEPKQCHNPSEAEVVSGIARTLGLTPQQGDRQ